MNDWQVEERMPRFDNVREFHVWLRDGSLRTVRRVGHSSTHYTPGVLLFTDCTHPLQNVLCNEDDVMGWKYSGRLAEKLPRLSLGDLFKQYKGPNFDASLRHDPI